MVTRSVGTGTQRGHFMGIKASGKRIHVTGLVVDKVANGKVVEEIANWDQLGFLQQLGAMPGQSTPPRK